MKRGASMLNTTHSTTAWAPESPAAPRFRIRSASALARAMAFAILAILISPGRSNAQDSPPADMSFVIETIEIAPPTRELELLVERGLGFTAGDHVPQEALIESKARLEATGNFREVEVHTRRGTKPGAIVVVVEATIGRRIRFETGIGHEDVTGWYLNLLGLRWTSPLHRGGSARVGFHTGLEMSGLFATLEVPGVPKRSLDGLVDVALFEQTWFVQEGREEYRQALPQVRYLLGARKTHEHGLSTTLWIGGISIDPADSLLAVEGGDEVRFPAADFLPPPSSNHLLEARAVVERNRRAAVDPWRKGTWSGAQIRAANSIDGGGFWQLQADTRRFVPVFDRSAFAFRLHAGYTSPGTPYHQRFQLGGTRHLRGFSNGRLSGPLGAQAVWVCSAEYRHPLLGIDRPEPRLLGTLFFDLGDHWNARGAPGSLAAGVGYGLQIQIPWVQVMTLDAAYPITDQPNVHSFVASLTLGRSF